MNMYTRVYFAKLCILEFILQNYVYSEMIRLTMSETLCLCRDLILLTVSETLCLCRDLILLAVSETLCLCRDLILLAVSETLCLCRDLILLTVIETLCLCRDLILLTVIETLCLCRDLKLQLDTEEAEKRFVKGHIMRIKNKAVDIKVEEHLLKMVSKV